MKTHNTCETLPSQATNCVCVGGGGGHFAASSSLSPLVSSHPCSRWRCLHLSCRRWADECARHSTSPEFCHCREHTHTHTHTHTIDNRQLDNNLGYCWSLLADSISIRSHITNKKVNNICKLILIIYHKVTAIYFLEKLINTLIYKMSESSEKC